MIDILLVLLIIFMLTALPDRKLISAQLPPETNPRATYQEVLTAMDVARGADVRVIGLLTSR